MENNNVKEVNEVMEKLQGEHDVSQEFKNKQDFIDSAVQSFRKALEDGDMEDFFIIGTNSNAEASIMRSYDTERALIVLKLAKSIIKDELSEK